MFTVVFCVEPYMHQNTDSCLSLSQTPGLSTVDFYVSCNAVKAAQQSEYLGISVKHLVTENQNYILKQSSITAETFFVDFARLTLHCQLTLQ